MSRRSSITNRIDSGISRELNSDISKVKIVADNIESVKKAAAVDLELLATTLAEATNFEGITVVAGDQASWDPATKVLTVPTLKGDTGAPLSIDSITPQLNGSFLWEFSDGTAYQTPSLKGPAGPTGPRGIQGEKGDINGITSIYNNPDGSFTWFLSDGSTYRTPILRGYKGEKGEKGDKGDVGDNITISSIQDLGTGILRIRFSDNTIYTTPSLRGEKGDEGPQGVKGDTGVSVHHIRPTDTTQPEGKYARAGYKDTYTIFGDPHETILLGSFSIQNGIGTTEQLEDAGAMIRSKYDADNNGIVDNSERWEGRSFSEVGTAYYFDTLSGMAAAHASLVVGDVIYIHNGGNWETRAVIGTSPLVTQITQDSIGYARSDTPTALETIAQTFPLAINELLGMSLDLQSDKYDKTGGVISGDVTITGNLIIQGSTTEVDTESLTVTDNIITVNKGEVSAGVTAGVAGIEVDRGTSTNYQILFDETTQTFRIGQIGELQAVATRSDTMTNNALVKWNNVAKRFDSVTGSISNNTTGNAATATALKTGRKITLSGGVTGEATFDGTQNVTITAVVSDNSHNHTIANVTGLQTALNSKVEKDKFSVPDSELYAVKPVLEYDNYSDMAAGAVDSEHYYYLTKDNNKLHRFDGSDYVPFNSGISGIEFHNVPAAAGQTVVNLTVSLANLTVVVFVNGGLLVEDEDYTKSGSEIVFFDPLYEDDVVTAWLVGPIQSLGNIPTDISNLTDNLGIIPTGTADLNNTAGFLTGVQAGTNVSIDTSNPLKPKISTTSTIDIASGAGTSTTSVMSQKAVTDELNTKANTSTQVMAGTGLEGGGNLSANRTLSVKYGTTAGTAAQGDDARLSDAREWTAATVSQAEAEAGTASTRQAWTAQRVRQAIAAWWLGVTSTLGRTLVGRATAAEMCGDLGLGTAATADVVQTLGSSIINVMSQDAITKEIKTIQDNIDELYTFNDLEDGLKWVTWDMASDTYSGNWGVTPVHLAMRRCVVNELAEVVYYLDPYDSTKKEDGSPANLDGTDGDVMVEMPQVWFRTVFNGTTRTDYVSHKPRTGFTLHPRFRGGAVSKIYIGAYVASVWDDSASAYIDGLNLDNNTSRIDLANDKLASVSGRFPMVGLTRAQFRTLAANAGGALEQFYEWQLLQLLFVVEYGNWNGQAVLARGNVDRTYLSSSSNQADSPHTVAGLSNTLGNQSGGLDNSSGTHFMSYRGVENFWGNCWIFIDGINYSDRASYVNDGSAPFADGTTTGYVLLGSALPEAFGSYIKSWQNLDGVFVPASVGGTSSTYIGDALWSNTGWRTALVGGRASNGLSAGPAICSGYNGADSAYRYHGSRLSRERLV